MARPRGPIGGKREKAKDFKGTMKKLMEHLKPFKIIMIFVVIFSIGSAAFNIIGPKILGNATTEIFNGLVNKVSGNGSGISFDKIGSTLLTLVVLYFISFTFSFLQTFLTSDISQKVSYQLRKEISEKINRLPLKYFDKVTHGEVLSRVTNDVDVINQNLNQILSQVITSATTLIGILIMMISISPIMTLVSLIVIPISLTLIALVVKLSLIHI